jgi:membrane protease YdiL (CAAX protease family)
VLGCNGMPWRSCFLSDFFLWLLIPGLAGGWEEPGFRGYALPRLQFRYWALLASLVLGVLWAFWHLQFVVTGEDIWIDALLFPIEWSIVYTWLFNNAKGSVLIVMLFHAMNNTFSSGFVGQMFSGADSVNQAWLRLILWSVVAIVLVVAAPSTCRASIKSKWNRLSLKQLRRPANDD